MLGSSFIPLLFDKTQEVISVIWYLLRPDLWSRMQPVLENLLWSLRRKCIVPLLDGYSADIYQFYFTYGIV